MTRASIIVVALLASIVIGFALGRNWNPASGPTNPPAADNEREVLYWVAPMDPDYRRDAPGKSPMGMELVPVYAPDSESGVVSIDPLIVSNLGVRTDVAESGILQRQIETVGYVGYDEDTLQHIHTRVDGWLEQLSVTSTGDAVERGQVLFELYSPTLVNAQEEYLAALQSRNTALHEASRERLAALGMTTAEIERLNKQRKVEQRVRVYAERDGVVAHLGVREGIYVTPATNVMSVADLDRVWILAEVFERQAAWVKSGHEAMVELDYLPGKLLYGTVDYVYPELDPQTRTLKVRLRFDNKTDELRPNMFARVTIRGDDTGEVVHVPREALIRGGTVDRVVMALGDGHFRAQPVEIGIESGGRVAIISGVSAGDRIVTSGQFLIDSESNIEAALSRMQGVSDEPVNETRNRSEPER